MSRGNMGKLVAILLVFGLFWAGCAKDKPPRSYVQANVIDKGYFQGEWWFATKVVDVRVTGAASGGPDNRASHRRR